MHQLCYFE